MRAVRAFRGFLYVGGQSQMQRARRQALEKAYTSRSILAGSKYYGTHEKQINNTVNLKPEVRNGKSTW